MTKKRIILFLVIFLAVACPLAAAFMLVTSGHPPRPLPPLTPIVSPTIFSTLLDQPPQSTQPAAVPIFATNSAIETQFAATAIALTPEP